ncbi:MAG: cation-translocating P-type ATPase [Ruminococcus sp.]|nr:cation-translocating P-type ATPase [Ruminococcus sp.]
MENKNIYNQSPEELFHKLSSGKNGLSDSQVAENRIKYGENKINEKGKKSAIRIFFEQFKDFLVIILIIAAIISAITGDIESTIIILVVIIMNAILGTIQMLKAENSLSDLKKLSAPEAKILRNNKSCLIKSENIVVGDILLLEAGDRIPADGRLIECASLQTNESALTGESTNIDKSMDPIIGEAALGDRHTMVYSGSFITYGRGKCIVTNVGMNTEVGKIAALIESAEERETPLQRTLDNFGRKLSIAIIIICVIVFGLQLWRAESTSFDSVMNSLMFAIALAVAAIPEALSSIVTIVLSFGTQKMSRENAIMRKLQAVEGLGSVSIICSDKTGTLTQNKMTVRKIVSQGNIIEADNVNVHNDEEIYLITASVLCNDSYVNDGTEIGDPTETALINFAHNRGLDDTEIRSFCKRISEIPFDSDRKLMSTLNIVNGKHIMFIKGAVDVLCERMNITASQKQQIKEQTSELSKKGLRLLCFAYKEFSGNVICIQDENDLNYMGMIAMMDPPRAESKQAVLECRSAGIKPVMITGDHIVTASAIAKEIGILERSEEAVEGCSLDNLSDEDMIDFVADKSVYARVTPEHKIRIVKAWQKRNCIVAMTGDGVNDAPALKQADVGVAMGITGTEVSKDAAAMVLADDNFATIVKAVKNGRNIYDNIKRSILFLLSGNFAGILVVLICSIVGFSQPFAPIHLLFINLLTDSLPAIALGFEPHSDEVMKRKPRPAGESILTKEFLSQIGISGVCIGAAALAAYMIGWFDYGSADLAMTLAFAVLCMSRLWHGFSCKSEKAIIFTKYMFNNRVGIFAFIVGMIVINSVLLIPALHGIFKISPAMTGTLFAAAHALSFGSMLLVQCIKAIICKIKFQ